MKKLLFYILFYINKTETKFNYRSNKSRILREHIFKKKSSTLKINACFLSFHALDVVDPRHRDRAGGGEEAPLGDAEDPAQEGAPRQGAAAADRGGPQDHLHAQRRRREAHREGQGLQEAAQRTG